MNYRNSKPDFINDKGTKWWVDHSTNDYIESVEIQRDVKLNISCWFFIGTDDYTSRVIIDTETNKIIYENQKLESIGTWIDMFAVSKVFPEEEK